MESERPHLSITLPRNFMFHYRDGSAPRTPEPEAQPEELQPPPPPRQVLKVRRRRTTLVLDYDNLEDGLDQRPIPTIEAPEPSSDGPTELPSLPQQDDAFLSPGVGFPRALSPPKTPLAQMRTINHYDGPQQWADIGQESQSETSSRPTSSSGLSDSSMSSCGSIGSFTSRRGSCASMDDDEHKADPLMYFSPPIDQHSPLMPTASHDEPRPAKKLKLRATFHEEMDHHLWMTYMKYLQDPTVTPFKALPSTVPPNGVCHRVARMARKTWKGGRSRRTGGLHASSQHRSRSGTPDTIKPSRSGSNTPIARQRQAFLRYPSEKQCRKRLRELAKQKPTLSAHYQRLLQRSPSPFQSSPPSEGPAHQRSLPSPLSADSTSFSTRDINVSLTTSTAPSMQLGNPLSQLATNIRLRQAERPWSSVRAHQKSQSLHIGLGLGIGSSLGSPLRGPSTSDVNNARTWHANSAMGQSPRLGSPFHAFRPTSKVFKRRTLHTFEDKSRTRGENLANEVFGAPAESSHRRVRSRGFSLGDMAEGARRLPLANDPSGFNPFTTLAPSEPVQAHAESIAVEAAQSQRTVRLGSPFGGRSSNTFPRGQLSHSFEAPTSFEERFAELPSTSPYPRCH